MHTPRTLKLALVTLTLGGCGSCSNGNTTPSDSGLSGDGDGNFGPRTDAALGTGEEGGVITYTVGGEIFQIAARGGATPKSLRSALNALASGGGDSSPSVSKNGAFMTLSTERFDQQCEGYACLAVVAGDLSSGGIVYVGGSPLRAEGRASVSNDGALLVFSNDGNSHQEDVFVTRKSGTNWSAAEPLTSSSPHSYNSAPVLSASGDNVLFDCGPVPYGQAGTGICEVKTDGSGFRQVINPANSPVGGGSSENQARSADYTPDGGIIFEADWASEQLWWLSPNSDAPVRIIRSQSNDNSPCALPQGYIASLWLGRPGGDGEHELKITAPNGSEFAVLTPGVDVADIGLSCHEAFVP